MTITTMPELRPLGMGQIIDRAARLYRQNFFTFVGIIAIAQIPASIFSTLVVLLPTQTDTLLQDTSPENFAAVMGTIGILSIIGFIVTLVMTQIGMAAMTRAISDYYLGQSFSIWETYRRLGRSWLSLIGAVLLIGLLLSAMFIAILILAIIPCIGWIAAIILGLPGGGIMVFATLVIIPLLAPIVVVERQGGRSAIYRAWDLARRRFWEVFGFILLLLVFSYLIVLGPTFLVTFVLQSLIGSGLNQVLSAVLQQVVGFVLGVLYSPLQLSCITLLYFDLRVRTEGFDLSLLAAATDETQNAMDVAAKTIPPQQPFSPTRTEIGYFCLITLGAGAVAVIIAVLFSGLVAALFATMGGGF